MRFKYQVTRIIAGPNSPLNMGNVLNTTTQVAVGNIIEVKSTENDSVFNFEVVAIIHPVANSWYHVELQLQQDEDDLTKLYLKEVSDPFYKVI